MAKDGVHPCWKQFGPSFEEQSAGPDATKLARADPAQLPAAGSRAPLRGPGTCLLQNTWSLKAPEADSSAPGRSETAARYQSHADHARQPPARSRHECNFPHPDYPNDYKTSKQVDYLPDVLARSGGRPRPCRMKDSGALNHGGAAADAQPWTTTSHNMFKGYDREERAAAGKAIAGNPNSNLPQYNIITGGSPLTNYTFEAWERTHDYRKTR